MAGRFINTDRTGVLMQHSMSDSIVKTVKEILQNPYYLFSDKRASKCVYYNLNTTMTTLDEATRGNYGEISPDSPLRFNRIKDFYIYGMGKIDPNFEVGEYGLEASEISGDVIILPYTVVPYPGDYFVLDQINGPLLFKVTGVDVNTLDTGAVMYKASYSLARSDVSLSEIEAQVVRRLKFLIQNMGTNFASFITEEVYDNASEMEEYLTMLKDYYISLFHDAKIQSFSYNYSNDGTVGGSMINSHGYDEFMGFKAYDPYLIEFMIRNKILDGSTNYIFVQHQMIMPQTFPIDYDRTFFRTLELKDINSHVGTFVGNLIKCLQRYSLLYAYPIDYYYMEYRDLYTGLYIIDIFDDPGFGDVIKQNTKLTNQDDVMKDIIRMYFNDEEITIDTLKPLRHLKYSSNKQMFYLIPMTIFCITKTLESLLANNSGGEL